MSGDLGVTGRPAGRAGAWSGGGSIARGLRDLGAIWRGVLGEDAYDKYRAHVEQRRAAGEPDHPLMTEREFWRDRTDRQDAQPQGRCC